MTKILGNNIKPITKKKAESFDRESYRAQIKEDLINKDVCIINFLIKTQYDRILKGVYTPIRQPRMSSLKSLNGLYNKEGFEIYVAISGLSAIRLFKG